MVEAVSVEAFHLSRVYRRAQGGARKGHTLQRPDVVYRGTVQVTDPDAFHAWLRRGVGRHRSFGFGMVLLERPSSPC